VGPATTPGGPVNRVTGQNLTGMLNAWLYGPTTPPMPGHPEWKTNPPPKD
jgi:hypothetical protein